MGWIGKTVGGVIGFIIGGPIGGAIGVGLGHVVEPSSKGEEAEGTEVSLFNDSRREQSIHLSNEKQKQRLEKELEESVKRALEDNERNFKREIATRKLNDKRNRQISEILEYFISEQYNKGFDSVRIDYDILKLNVMNRDTHYKNLFDELRSAVPPDINVWDYIDYTYTPNLVEPITNILKKNNIKGVVDSSGYGSGTIIEIKFG